MISTTLLITAAVVTAKLLAFLAVLVWLAALFILPYRARSEWGQVAIAGALLLAMCGVVAIIDITDPLPVAGQPDVQQSSR